MTNDPQYREATTEELVHLAERIKRREDWVTARGFARKYYGEAAASITIEELGEYDDERYSYNDVTFTDENGDEQVTEYASNPFYVRDSAGRALWPDLSLPAWRNWSRVITDDYDRMKAHWDANGWDYTELNPRALLEPDWMHYETTVCTVCDKLCELRDDLPPQGIVANLQVEPLPTVNPVYIAQEDA